MEFAQEVIEECAAFPFGDHDDLVDSMTQAVMRFRQGGLIQHPEDYQDEPLQQKTKSVLLGNGELRRRSLRYDANKLDEMERSYDRSEKED